jgi:4'-phosphopantetheinyl transferase
MSGVDLRNVEDAPHAVLRSGVPLVWLLPDDVEQVSWCDFNPALLSQREQDRLSTIRHPLTRFHFLRGRTMLRVMLARHLGGKPNDIPLTVNAHGKPVLADHSLHFNVTHTEGLLAFVIGHSPVGIDAERTQANRDLPGLVNRYFSTTEQTQFAELPVVLQPAAFLRGWTCKEALLKAIGTGMRDVQNCTVELDPLKPAKVIDPTGWKVTTTNHGKNIAVAVVW